MAACSGATWIAGGVVAPSSFWRRVSANMHREIREEVAAMPQAGSPIFMGVINEEETEVGTVHLGLVHSMTVYDPENLHPGEEIIDFQWMPRSQVESMHLELWSRLALELVEARRRACIIQVLHWSILIEFLGWIYLQFELSRKS